MLDSREKLMSAEEKQEREQRLAEAKERRRRTISPQEVKKHLASDGDLKSSSPFGVALEYIYDSLPSRSDIRGA